MVEVTASRTTVRRSDQPVEKPEWIAQDGQPVIVYETMMNAKSAIQSRIVEPEPAKATTTVDSTGSTATKPLISVLVVSFLDFFRSISDVGDD